MKGSKFYIRIINILVILLIIFYYNNTINTYALQETNAQLQADLQTEQKYSSELLAKVQEVLGEEAVSTEEAENDSPYKDGTYTGDAQGYGGIVKMEVVISGGMITEINVLSAENEDEAYYNMAVKIIEDMISEQNPNVDTVSGATYTSTGIKNAVIAALKQAVK